MIETQAENTETQKDAKAADEEILRVARERFKLIEEAEKDIRKLAEEDLRFRAGEQWPEEVIRLRKAEERPCLTINRIPQFVRQITNEQRQNRPQLRVSPVDSKADIDTAKIMQGMIKHIEVNSGADAAYDTAFEGAVIKSFGYFRIVTDYLSPYSFDQEILIKRIRNHFSVGLDPHRKEPDGSDSNYGFIFNDVPKDDFNAEYGESKLCGETDWKALNESTDGWVSESSVRVAEYYYKEFKTVTIYLLSDGTVVEDGTVSALPAGVTITAERKARVPTIHHLILNGHEILERTIWPGQWIPIIEVIGDELDINGKRVLEGIVRHAKDSQRMYNYWASTETETIALTPKAPYIVAEGQITKEHQQSWATANSRTHAYLTYKPVANAPAPQRNTYEPAVGAITNARALSADDLKATTGIYDSAMGAKSNETSGVAIRGRQAQAHTSNFHFVDNLTRSLRHTARILVDLIPKIYDSERAQRILGEEGEEEIIFLNKMFERKGKNTLVDLSAGKYDVAVDTGPNFATKRAEASASMMDLTRSFPKVAEVAGDIMVNHMDFPGAKEISERLKLTLPPGLAPDDKTKQQVPPQIQQQLAQMDELIQKQTATINQQSEIIKTKKLELDSREKMKAMELETHARVELLKLSTQDARFELEQQLKQLDQIQSQPVPTEDEYFEQDLNASGPDQAAMQMEQQQPTGGETPGTNTGV